MREIEIKKQSVIIAVMVLILLFAETSCNKTDSFIDKLKQPIVAAYLFEGKPIENICIKQSVAINDDKDSSPISNLEVTLTYKDKTIALTPNKDKPGFYKYAGVASDFSIIQGNTYTMKFKYDGIDVSSKTTIPSPPVSLTSDKNSISYYSLDGVSFDSNTFKKYIDENLNQKIILKWKNPDKKFFFVTIEFLETKKVPIFGGSDASPSDFTTIGGLGAVSVPINSDSVIVNSTMIQYLGRHKLTLYAVNDEYIRLYENLVFDSRNLNEPYTNVINGKGIFTGFSGKSIEFSVLRR